MREVTVISSMKQRWTLRSQPHLGGYETQAGKLSVAGKFREGLGRRG